MDILHFSLLIIVLAFVCEYVDSSLGMGYGTTLTPLLLILGYKPLQIVPAILLSELITGISAGFLHHRLKNVDLRFGGIDLKIVGMIAGASVVGTVTAVLIALNLPGFYIKLYIGILVLSMGILILVSLKKSYRFSWKKSQALVWLLLSIKV